MTDKTKAALAAYNAAVTWRQNIGYREDAGEWIPAGEWEGSDDMFVEAAHLLNDALVALVQSQPIVFIADGEKDYRRGDVDDILFVDLDDAVDDIEYARDAVARLVEASADQADIDTIKALWGDDWEDEVGDDD